MRNIVLKDHAIDKDECLALLDEYSEYLKKHTGVDCEWFVEGYDFSRVPTVPDSDGDLKPTEAYRKALYKEVHDRYGNDGVDNVVIWVHEKHFTFAGIWGVNWSYMYGTYSMHLCRWDRDNDVNTFNTLFHEQAHSWDRLILEEIGVDIEPLAEGQLNLKNFDYDRDFVHGKSSRFPYIGRRGFTRENKDTVSMLTFLAPYLRRAYAVRKERHMKKLGMMQQIVKLLSTVVSLLSKKIK